MPRKTSIAAAVIAVATAGSAFLGGTALAGEHGDEWDIAGPGGKAGDAKAECFVPIAASVGAIIGQGGDITQCNAVGGDGGAGGSADDY